MQSAEKIRRILGRVARSVISPSSAVSAAKNSKPSVFIVTLPKSGSVFIQKALTLTTGLAPMLPSQAFFPSDNLSIESMVEFVTGGYVAQTHCDPSELNLRILDYFEIDWMLQFRDPRAALLSWTHHVERPDIGRKPTGLLRISPPLPDRYLDWPFQEKLDWQIAAWYPGMLNWIEQWYDVLENPAYRQRIHLTTYEEMHGRDEPFISDLIQRFHGQAPKEIKLPAKELMVSHFRSGRRDEWREVFSDNQIERATAAISPRLRERFDWN